jgi:hypothetical protein
MEPVGKRWRRLAGGAVGAAFVAVIALPEVCKLLHYEPLPRVHEFRARATRPRMPRSRKALEAFPGRFEDYFNDHFGLRPVLMRGMHRFKGEWLGVPTAANIILGTDDWLYYTEKPTGTDYNAVRPFIDRELQSWGRALQKRHDWLKRRGIPYVVFVPPDKQTVYPEHLPPEQRPPRARMRLHQLKSYLREHSSVPFLDVRDLLLAAKARERVYHVTDSHWNDRGAFVGYQALLEVLSRWFPTMRPRPRAAFLDFCEHRHGGDLAQMIAREDSLREDYLQLLPLSVRRAHAPDEELEEPDDCPLVTPPRATECDDRSLPRVVVFNDSFCWALQPFLAEHFRRAVFAWTDNFSPELVRREHPNLVIQEMVERKLGAPTPHDFDDHED